MEWYTEWHRRKEGAGGGGREAVDAGAGVSSQVVEAREGRGRAEGRGGAEARGLEAKTPQRPSGDDITPKPLTKRTWSQPAWYSMVLTQRPMNAGF